LNLSDYLQWNLTLFMLIFSRWAGMVMLAPVFGAKGVPAMIRLGLAAGLSIVVYPLIQAQNPVIPNALLPLIGILVKETLLGLTIGFIINLLSMVMQGAGQLIDFQLGFMTGNVIDPINGMQSPMTGSFLAMIATMLLLATNSHYYIIAAVTKSYEFLPINPAGVNYGAEFFIEITGKVLSLSLQIAMPVFGAILLADVGVGLLAKIVPQLNMFSVIFPVKIIFGLAMLYLMIAFFGDTVSRVFDITMQWIFELFRGWSV